MSPGPSESDLIQAFRDAMASAGVSFAGPLIADGKLHRVDIAGRSKGRKDGYYTMHLDFPPSGVFGDFKVGLQDTWTATKPQQMTPEEREILRQRVIADRKLREAETAAAHEAAAKVAEKMIAEATDPDPAHPYLVRKGVRAFGRMRQAKDGKLLIPLVDTAGKLWSVQTIADDGTKRFLKGGRKGGLYFSIGKLTDPIVECEGYATAATLHEATSLCIVIAFDAGNLDPVAKALKAKFPKHGFVVAADDDHAEKGNPGRTKGKAAADGIDARLVLPAFGADAFDGDKPRTDFNDLHAFAGLDEVRRQFEGRPTADVVDLAEVRKARQTEENPLEYDDTPSPSGLKEPIALGHDVGLFYYMSARTKQVVALSASAHNTNNFLHLAPLTYWELNYPGAKGTDWTAAANAMMAMCEDRIYNPNLIAGRGVRLDSGRVVLHLGDRLIVDGKINGGRETPSLVLEGSKLIYQHERQIDVDRVPPLDEKGGAELIETVGLLPWTRSDMAAIFAGWLVTASICGAMRWRPHLWLSGPAGSGKSWVLSNVAGRALGSMCVRVGGVQVTEAGIRQELQKDALPVLFDESESQDERSRERLQAIMSLARQASSEDTPRIVKGSQSGRSISYEIKSPFLFSSINMGATQSADQSRTISLTLEGPPQDENAEQRREREDHFAYIQRRFDSLFAQSFSSRLFGRALKLVKTIRANTNTLASAMSEINGQRRLADTHSGPLAGWLALQSEELLTIERARVILSEQAWVVDMADRNRADPDHDQAIKHLMVQTIRVSPAIEKSVGDLINDASQCDLMDRTKSQDFVANRALRMYGIRVDPGSSEHGVGLVYLARSHARLSSLFVGTPWAQRGWEGVIEQHPRVQRAGNVYFAPGANNRALAFNMGDLLGVGR